MLIIFKVWGRSCHSGVENRFPKLKRSGLFWTISGWILKPNSMSYILPLCICFRKMGCRVMAFHTCYLLAEFQDKYFPLKLTPQKMSTSTVLAIPELFQEKKNLVQKEKTFENISKFLPHCPILTCFKFCLNNRPNFGSRWSDKFK